MSKTIGNPISAAASALGRSAQSVEAGIETIGSHDLAQPTINPLTMPDLGRALKRGFQDFTAMRTDVMFMAVAYPLIGLLIAGLAFQTSLAPLLLPVSAGFAILGPIVCVGLYEMSKRRERGTTPSWGQAFGAVRPEIIGPLLAMAAYLLMLFTAWLFAADLIHQVAMGGAVPATLGAFIVDVTTTTGGITMLVLGTLVGFVFALIALVTTVVAAPMLVDRPVGLPLAVSTSVRVARANTLPILAWGAIVAVLLAIGIATAFIGLIVVLPVLGHATWHLYRAAVSFDPAPENRAQP